MSLFRNAECGVVWLLSALAVTSAVVLANCKQFRRAIGPLD